MPLVELNVLEVREWVTVLVLLGQLHGWYFVRVAAPVLDKGGLKDIQADIDVFVYPAKPFDQPCLLGEDGMELDKVGATADVDLFCIDSFPVPAIELVGIAAVEEFLITGQNSESHVGREWERRKRASRSIRTRLEIAAAAWEKVFLGAYLHNHDRVTAGRQPGAVDKAERSWRVGPQAPESHAGQALNYTRLVHNLLSRRSTASRQSIKLAQADLAPATAKRAAGTGQRIKLDIGREKSTWLRCATRGWFSDAPPPRLLRSVTELLCTKRLSFAS